MAQINSRHDEHSKAFEFILKIPATSANVGPGYDQLGLALEYYNETVVVSNRSAEEESKFIHTV